MAIKHLVDDRDQHRILFIGDILAQLEANEPNVNSLERAQELCEELVSCLLHVQVPTQASAIKDYKGETARVTEIFKRIVERSGDFQNVFVFCLRTLYRQIVQMIDTVAKPSSAAAIIFNFYDEELIPKVIQLLFTNSPSYDVDHDVKKVIGTLCNWLRSSSGYVHLSKCIVDLLEGLRKQQKFDLLMEIANEVIEPLFIALVIPFIRPNVMPVVEIILTSVQHTPEIFQIIIPRIPRVLHAIDQTISTPQNGDVATGENLQKLVDIVSALILHFPASDGSYDEVEQTLRKHSQTYNFQDVLHVNPWHSFVQAPLRDPSVPLGLVNLGNTCYMNSVLQALFMTKQFTNEILKMNCALQTFRPIQELFALMLYSIRPYVTPYNAMATRPMTFRNGYQQDSFEYLGYLLDTLFEEEKKFIISVKTRKNQLNNNGYNNGNNHLSQMINTLANGFDSQPSPDGTDSATSVSSMTNMDAADDSPSRVHSSSMEVDTPTDDAAALPIDDCNEEFGPIAEKDPLDVAECILPGAVIALPPPRSASTPPATPPPPALQTSLSPSTPFKQPTIVVTNTLVQRTFTGKATITHTCLQCSNESKTIDHFNELPLAFPNQGDYPDETEYSTQQLLNDYFVTEKLVDDNKYSCEKCKALCDGERKLRVAEGPANLILVIKHFKYDRRYNIRRKLTHKVHHNEEVTLKVTGEKGDAWQYKYRMRSVIVHCGINIDSGHYFTFAADANDNWFKLNDSHISRSSLNELMHSTTINTPYILFYELMDKVRVHPMAANVNIDDVMPIGNGIEAYNGDYSPISSGSGGDVDQQLYDSNTPVDSSPSSMHECNGLSSPVRSPTPTLESLSPYLQDIVRSDNQSYRNEIHRNNAGRTDFLNFYNGNRRSDDRDRDPPSSCGDNANIITNRCLY